MEQTWAADKIGLLNRREQILCIIVWIGYVQILRELTNYLCKLYSYWRAACKGKGKAAQTLYRWKQILVNDCKSELHLESELGMSICELKLQIQVGVNAVQGHQSEKIILMQCFIVFYKERIIAVKIFSKYWCSKYLLGLSSGWMRVINLFPVYPLSPWSGSVETYSIAVISCTACCDMHQEICLPSIIMIWGILAKHAKMLM